MEVERGSLGSAVGETLAKRKREADDEASPTTTAYDAGATRRLGHLQELSPSGKLKEDGASFRGSSSPLVSGQVAPTRGSLAPAGNRRVQLLHPPNARALAPAGADDPENMTPGEEFPDDIQMKEPSSCQKGDHIRKVL